ncbi:sulfite exporter TauE/SafE family protein [Niabella sp. CC-SYL272]|uniref:sulfite exporter TauE/SafE family protein n=1 Tax=Niabella agricola TaxID=2891571 RepID=UPI001F34FDB8|nr:sulfite exporter TauE/SafE family protein [Niabella agricola]MCF3108522.1 sulfite exporter TauE/SafE family protein [Niabella agricola]
MVEALLGGLGMGIAGSFHCIGMCGPLALSIPLDATSSFARLLSILLYNLGRMLTYFLMGVILGWAGYRFAIIGYQQYFSIAMGMVLLLMLLPARYLPEIKWFKQLQQRIKGSLARFLTRRNRPFSFLAIGMLNGLLPCGLVYMAIATALVIGHSFTSGVFMAAFGLGTIPLMAVLMLTGHHLSFSLRLRIKKMLPYFVAVVAVLMVLRGLNLGIPYVSPAFPAHVGAVDCHPVK